MIRPLTYIAAVALLISCGDDPSADRSAINSAAVHKALPKAHAPAPATARVRIETELGTVVVELDGRHAPITTANFLAYADDGRFDGTSFYRAARTRGAPERGFIQGGIRRNYQRMLPPIAHEPTSRTGLRHGEGAISMAKADGGAGAMGEFFITANAMPAMNAHGAEPGFAVFGRVVEGMDVVRRILAAPTVPNAGRGSMRGQMIERPVRIVTVRRVDSEGRAAPAR
ncbi:MAG TPA: peptidylprolyl isomerase [Allosphingosinicella sp.]|nr:peptidylprolyl isomerase [Allosphingosinicella sp.]